MVSLVDSRPRNPDEPAGARGRDGRRQSRPCRRSAVGRPWAWGPELDGSPFGIDVPTPEPRKSVMPHGTAELAIGHGPEAGLLLLTRSAIASSPRTSARSILPAAKSSRACFEASGTQEAPTMS